MIEIWEGLARDREKAGTLDISWADKLKDSYDDIAREPIPPRFRHLLKQLEAAETRHR